ncbi:MAG: hypothetical protein KDC13_07125 [Bacteroidetes bacterium]|nr:hypothetical protein [Bacteroidota bacterium]
MIKAISSIFGKLVGSKADRDMQEIRPLLNKILEIYPGLENISHDELRARTAAFKEKINAYVKEERAQIKALTDQVEASPDMELHEKEALYEQADKLKKLVVDKLEEVLMEILPEAFAVMRETARRFKENDEIVVTASQFDRDLSVNRDHIRIDNDKAVYRNSWMAAGNEIKWDMVHYEVQLIGGIMLHKGKISEMATGEGKTLVATLPVYLNALSGEGVHVVTVNDYLARRDSEWMGSIYEFHGLRVDCIDKHQPNSSARRAAYTADITFGTNNEFGFDYLRDNMARTPEELVQRGHNYAIVDEVDSVLIDDARTPLIISGPTPKGDNQEFFFFYSRV